MDLAAALALALLFGASAPAEAPEEPAPGTVERLVEDRTGELGSQDHERLSRQIAELKGYKGVVASALLVDSAGAEGLEALCRKEAAKRWTADISSAALVCVSRAERAVSLETSPSLRAELTDPVSKLIVERASRHLARGNVADAVASAFADLLTPPHDSPIDPRLAGPIVGLLPFLLGFLAAAAWERLLRSKVSEGPAFKPVAVALGAVSLAGPVLVGAAYEAINPGHLFDFAIVAFFLQLPGAFAFLIVQQTRNKEPPKRRLGWLAAGLTFVAAAIPCTLATAVWSFGPDRLLVVTVVGALLSPFVGAIAGRSAVR